jgi:hypothetical protein
MTRTRAPACSSPSASPAGVAITATELASASPAARELAPDVVPFRPVNDGTLTGISTWPAIGRPTSTATRS